MPNRRKQPVTPAPKVVEIAQGVVEYIDHPEYEALLAAQQETIENGRQAAQGGRP